jgi:hypothetical protein
MPTQTKHRVQSSTVNNPNDTNVSRNDRLRRGEGLLSLPIIRPFLRGSHQGFSDQKDELNSNVAEEDDNDDDVNNLPSSKEDRAIMMKSISDGISGSNNNDPILLNNASASPVVHRRHHQLANTPNHPNLLDRIFSTRFIQITNRNEKSLLIQLHHLIRKEDWSLATELLESKPVLARRWHPVERLYGGRFDGEALPIHAACALRPPASFLQMLGSIYPEGLMQKEKSFGRTPLHIACRSLAEASVINVLCKMEPRSVMERDKLKRVPLHYMVRNYDSFGEDDEDEDEDEDKDTDDESVDESTNNESDCKKEPDGIVAFNHLVETNADCVKVADHRGWIPLHVACNTSFRHGMIHVMKILIELWPESVLAKTEKNSDVFACVDMGGTFAIKDKVVELLKEARQKVEKSEEDDEEEGECSSASDPSDLHSGIESESSSSEGQDVDEVVETQHSSDVVVGNLIELDSFDILCEGDQVTDDNSGCLPLFDADMHPQVIQTAQDATADFAANAQESEQQLSTDSVKEGETYERETSHREIGGNVVEHDS